ncbi:MAG: tetratricopeptide repeat protein [Proteobacteria bacterium]|nr:tetratricopeptide repeat protein [Pseudomonadota bacterium]
MTFATRFRTVLLATTGLVLAGCNTISDNTATADAAESQQAPAVSTPVDKKSPEAEGWSQVMRVADRAWAKNDAATAMRLYATAAKQQPKNTEPLIKIAQILRKTGRVDDAISVYEKTLAIDPNNVEAHHGIGYSHLQLEKPYLATRSFANALRINPKDASSLGGLGIAYDKAGDHKKAQEYYKQAVKSDPSNLNYKSNLALSLALSGQTEKAIAILKVVTDSPEATAKHRQTLALAYGLAGKSKEAMAYSRMDLTEKDARNNALYFEALNGRTDVRAQAISEQINIMHASNDDVISELAAAEEGPTQPDNPDVLIARQDKDRLDYGTADKGKKAAVSNEAPKTLVPAPTAPVVIAKAETVPAKKMQTEVKVPTVTASAPKAEKPMVVADAAKPAPVKAKTSSPSPKPAKKKAAAPVAPKMAAKKDKEDIKPRTFVNKSSDEVETEVAAVDPVSPNSSFREWKMDDKPAKPSAVAEAAPAAVEPSTTVTKENAAFVPGNRSVDGDVGSYKPDGGKYYIQLGSYKERAHAEKGWLILQTQNSDILEGIDPVITEADLGPDNGGIFYRLQVGGFSKKADPMLLCGTLRDRSHDCFMPMGTKAGTPKKSAPALAPDQRIAEGTPAAKGNDSNVIADTQKASGAL